uniref:Uncharacterized protein n=1 Tax=Oryza brachyantha TaxID=4533 RepID=J3LUN3_ORYBR
MLLHARAQFFLPEKEKFGRRRAAQAAALHYLTPLSLTLLSLPSTYLLRRVRAPPSH